MCLQVMIVLYRNTQMVSPLFIRATYTLINTNYILTLRALYKVKCR